MNGRLLLGAAFTALLYGAYNFSIKLASGSIHQILGAVILQVVAAAIGGSILLMLKIANQPLEATPKGVLWATIAGVAVGLAEISSFYVFSKGLSATVGTPLIIGGSVVAGFALGWIILKEPVSIIQIGGLLLIVLGITLVSK